MICLLFSIPAKLDVMLWLQAMYKTLGYSEFFNWQIYDAFSLLADIMQSAGKRMIGNYACVSTLNLPQKKEYGSLY